MPTLASCACSTCAVRVCSVKVIGARIVILRPFGYPASFSSSFALSGLYVYVPSAFASCDHQLFGITSPVIDVPRPSKIVLTIASRSIAYAIAWRTRTSS